MTRVWILLTLLLAQNWIGARSFIQQDCIHICHHKHHYDDNTLSLCGCPLEGLLTYELKVFYLRQIRSYGILN